MASIEKKLSRLTDPMSTRMVVTMMVVVTVVTTIYCLGYNWLNGRSETLANAVGWPITNLVPWLAALALFNRWPSIGGGAILLAAATLISLILGWTLMGESVDGFSVWRRLPSLMAMTVIFLGLWRSRPTRAEPVARAPLSLPFHPDRIDWIRAAGNYIEIHTGDGRCHIVRAALSDAQSTLSGHGFVRIHRGTLVRTAAIDLIRRHDVRLRCGTLLRIGAAYRSALGH